MKRTPQPINRRSQHKRRGGDGKPARPGVILVAFQPAREVSQKRRYVKRAEAPRSRRRWSPGFNAKMTVRCELLTGALDNRNCVTTYNRMPLRAGIVGEAGISAYKPWMNARAIGCIVGAAAADMATVIQTKTRGRSGTHRKALKIPHRGGRHYRASSAGRRRQRWRATLTPPIFSPLGLVVPDCPRRRVCSHVRVRQPGRFVWVRNAPPPYQHARRHTARTRRWCARHERRTGAHVRCEPQRRGLRTHGAQCARARLPRGTFGRRVCMCGVCLSRV